MEKEIKFIEQILAKLLQEKRLQEGMLKTYEDHLKDKRWVTDIEYLNYETGKAKIKISEINYIYDHLEKRYKNLQEKYKKTDVFLQQKMM